MTRVRFLDAQYPRCGSRRLRCYGSKKRGAKRYLQCRVCENRFVAWRLEVAELGHLDEDRPHVRTAPTGFGAAPR